MKNSMLITIVIVIVVAAGAFYAGMQYQQMQRRSAFAGASGQRGTTGQRNRPVMGEILTKDDKSITVKIQDGSSKIVVVSATTSINKAASATKSDLKTGEKVAVFGSENSDGSVTAQSIQLNPPSRMMGGQQPSNK